MKLLIEIKMDNDAFGTCDQEAGAEAGHILADLAKHLENGEAPFGEDAGERVLHDSNGNRIGQAAIGY